MINTHLPFSSFLISTVPWSHTHICKCAAEWVCCISVLWSRAGRQSGASQLLHAQMYARQFLARTGTGEEAGEDRVEEGLVVEYWKEACHSVTFFVVVAI